MIVHQGYKDLKLTAPVVTMGMFDGVHRGHMALIERLNMRARENNGESVVVTFSPHPRTVLERAGGSLSFLTTMQEKQELLRKAGIDHLIVIDFTQEFSRIKACDFIKDILIGGIGTKHLIAGFNHRFGNQAGGDPEMLKSCAESLDFIVEQVPGYISDGFPVSSSSIREALLDGRLGDANKWLGYAYQLRGAVIEGRKIGRSLGFPTANINPEEYKLVPSNGVYAVKVQTDGRTYPGMLSIGVNPTVKDDNTRSIEVHIIGLDQDLYGQRITLFFHERLRDEIRFSSTQELARQMNADMDRVIDILG